jgi:MFS family permease
MALAVTTNIWVLMGSRILQGISAAGEFPGLSGFNGVL